MPRQTRQELDDEILEIAATLFARHGFRRTSVQSIADAVGYSKAGLLHRYPSKEALQDAVIERCLQLMQQAADGVCGLAPGPDRDLVAISAFARLAVAHPGAVALLLSLLSGLEPSEYPARMHSIGQVALATFGVVISIVPEAGTAANVATADPATDPQRVTRVVGALGGLAVARLSLRGDSSPDLTARLVAVAYDALGHGRTPTV